MSNLRRCAAPWEIAGLLTTLPVRVSVGWVAYPNVNEVGPDERHSHSFCSVVMAHG